MISNHDESIISNLTSACACIGKQFDEPECPCAMRRLGLPPSEERIAYNNHWNSPEGKEIRELELQNLQQLFKGKK
jgi:hypothetical protein